MVGVRKGANQYKSRVWLKSGVDGIEVEMIGVILALKLIFQQMSRGKGYLKFKAGQGCSAFFVGYSLFKGKKKGVQNFSEPLIFRVAGATRLELATSGVTGRRSNQTELRPRMLILFLREMVGGTGLEPVTYGL